MTETLEDLTKRYNELVEEQKATDAAWQQHYDACTAAEKRSEAIEREAHAVQLRRLQYLPPADAFRYWVKRASAFDVVIFYDGTDVEIHDKSDLDKDEKERLEEYERASLRAVPDDEICTAIAAACLEDDSLS